MKIPYSKQTVVTLRYILKQRSLPTTGLKQVLIDRLVAEDATQTSSTGTGLNELASHPAGDDGLVDAPVDEEASGSHVANGSESALIPTALLPACATGSGGEEGSSSDAQLLGIRQIESDGYVIGQELDDPTVSQPTQNSGDLRLEILSTERSRSSLGDVAPARLRSKSNIIIEPELMTEGLPAPRRAQSPAETVLGIIDERMHPKVAQLLHGAEEDGASGVNPEPSNELRESERETPIPSIESADPSNGSDPASGTVYAGIDFILRSPTQPFTRTPSIVRKRKHRRSSYAGGTAEAEIKKARLDSTYASEDEPVSAGEAPQNDMKLSRPKSHPSAVEHTGDKNLQNFIGLGDHTLSEIQPKSPDRLVDEQSSRATDNLPSLHEPTRALYIRNLTRPLVPTTLQSHLLSKLARSQPDDSAEPMISIFFVDPVKTHCFVIFAAASDAREVRRSIHDRVWPDEKMRKALWVDYVDPTDVLRWISLEEAASQTRGHGIKKWEVVYHDVGGVRQAELYEVGKGPMQAKDNYDSTSTLTKRTLTSSSLVPEKSSSERQDLSNTESPAKIGGGSHAFKTLDELFSGTSTKPMLYFQTVDRHAYHKRLDFFDELAKSQKGGNLGSSQSGERTLGYCPSKAVEPIDFHQYSFEGGDHVVDCGPHRPPQATYTGRSPPIYSDRGSVRRGYHGYERGRLIHGDHPSDRGGGSQVDYRKDYHDDNSVPVGGGYRGGYRPRGSRDDRSGYRGWGRS